jgi:hypothetical protein
MIQWKAIIWGEENALQNYDMTGADIASVVFSKAGFGGEYSGLLPIRHCTFLYFSTPCPPISERIGALA